VLEESIVDPPGWGEGSGSSGIERDDVGISDIDGIGRSGETERVKGNWKGKGKERRYGEDGICDEEREYRRQPRLRSWQGNLSFKKFMHVLEGGELRAGPNG